MIAGRIVFGVVVTCLGCLPGCMRRQALPNVDLSLHYTVGVPWQSGGYWFYPEEELSYQATGLAVIDAQEGGSRRQTADGECYDPRSATGAHQTLQLPIILRVRNLENGRELSLRINDRGPTSPGRLLSVTPRAGQLLGLVPGGATRVRVSEDEDLTRALLQHVAGAPQPQATAAPLEVVQEWSLLPNEGRDNLSVQRSANAPPSERESSVLTTNTVSAHPPQPGQLWVDAGQFSTSKYAKLVAASLGGVVQPQGLGRSVVFKVRAGPFDTVGQADTALDHALLAGVTGARIIVE